MFFWNFYSKNPEKMHHGIKKNIKMFSTLIRKFSTNQHIRMIFEGSRDTEDLSNDAENWALPSQK